MTPQPRSIAPTRRRHFSAITIVLALIMTFSVMTPASASSLAVAQSGTASSVKMANLANFRAGNIISDSVFFASDTMSAPEIDSFFRGKVTNCNSNFTCLKDYRQSTPNRAADSYCAGYQGAPNESAATIISKASESCGINPQVLIVMLEKEQSLVTHTWPSPGRFDAALGQGCPDTAPCDPAFSGFFYQIYGAARQMKIYTEGKWFTWYAPGKTWNILYNPVSSCGTSPVYIENKATAALYYYTPYQPNAAALRAGYGTGDACSSYGNRNFYNLFTDWFGSTQVVEGATGSAARLIKLATANEIYLAVNGQRMHVLSQTDLSAFVARLGNVRIVSPSTLNSYAAGPDASRLIRDGRDGALYLLEPDGSRHWFPSADLVTSYGYSMAGFTPLPAETVDSYPRGADVSAYFKGDASSAYYKREGNSKRHIVNDIAWNYVAPDAHGYLATLAQSTVDAMPKGAAVLGPRSLVKEQSSPEVYIAGFGPELLHISSWASATELGVTDLRVVPDNTLEMNPRAKGNLTPVLTCNGTNFIIGDSAMTPLTGSIGNTPAVRVPDSVCAALPQTGRTLQTPLLIKAATSPDIYSLTTQGYKYVRSESDLQALLAGKPASLYSSLSASSVAMMPAAGWLREGSLVGFGTDEIYVVRGGVLRHILSRDTLMSVTAPEWPVITVLPAQARASYPEGEPLP